MNLSELLKSTRQYFWSQNFTEVEIPYLNSSLPLEPNIYSFVTKWRHRRQNFYLPTSPEMALKAHLSTTPENCFAIGHCFRDLEDSNETHTPEFLMLEYYLVNQNLSQLQKSLEDYLRLFLPTLKFSHLELPPLKFSTEPDFNQYFLNEIEPKLPLDSAVFITGYPTFLSPLAKPRLSNVATNFRSAASEGFTPAGPRASQNSVATLPTSSRFELYINGIEIANGCEENRNSEQITQAFENENKSRQKNRLPLHPYSSEFIKNSSLLPPCSGVGLGLGRLLKIVYN